MTTNIKVIRKQGLCIGCGLCAVVCPNYAIVMLWGRNLTWVPQIDVARCTDCSLCYQICPTTPECICEYAIDAAEEGEHFGLSETAQYFIAYDLNSENRIRSASGGGLTAILMHLLEAGDIDGVIASVPVAAVIGKPHYELRVIRSLKELDGSRSSHYHPLCYDKVFADIKERSGRYALVGVPCIIRGIKRIPEKFQNKIRYTFSLVCSHNATGAFLDFLAKQEGIVEGEIYSANFRDKFGGIPDADNFNIYFKLSDREIRRNRFESVFTDMWRNYFFAQESCLYCPDFYGIDADISAKDAWGDVNNNPLGASLLIVRNPELVSTLQELKESRKLFLKECSRDETLQTDPSIARFKHQGIFSRLIWKNKIRKELTKNEYPLTLLKKSCLLKYWKFRIEMVLSNFFYTYFKYVPVTKIIKIINRITLNITQK